MYGNDDLGLCFDFSKYAHKILAEKNGSHRKTLIKQDYYTKVTRDCKREIKPRYFTNFKQAT